MTPQLQMRHNTIEKQPQDIIGFILIYYLD